jgi:hypothetical protein
LSSKEYIEKSIEYLKSLKLIWCFENKIL